MSSILFSVVLMLLRAHPYPEGRVADATGIYVVEGFGACVVLLSCDHLHQPPDAGLFQRAHHIR